MTGPAGGVTLGTIKRYGGERLYDPCLARYVTLDDLADRLGDGDGFRALDAESGADVTRDVLARIVERTDR